MKQKENRLKTNESREERGAGGCRVTSRGKGANNTFITDMHDWGRGAGERGALGSISVT